MDRVGGTKVKREDRDMEEEGACGWSEDIAREFTGATREARHRLRESAAKMARDAGLSPAATFRSVSPRNVAIPEEGSSQHSVATPTVKTPKYSGKAAWEAFLAQFELLSHAGRWSTETKALQLALCLTDDALSCLLLLSPEDRRSYQALVGALQRRFGQCLQPELLRNELNNRCRKPGESRRRVPLLRAERDS